MAPALRTRYAVRPFRSFLSLCVLFCGLGGTAAAQSDDPLKWPEPQRAFFQDGPGLLLTPEQRAELIALDEAGRERWIREFLERDPDLKTGIDRRQRLGLAEYASPLDVRAQI